MNPTRRHRRGPSRFAFAAAIVLTTVFGPVSGPARADSIDEKRRQAAAIADQLDALAERMRSEEHTSELQSQ